MTDEERVAEAIYESFVDKDWMTADVSVRAAYKERAKLAIAAMGLVDDASCRDPHCSYRAEILFADKKP